MIEIIKQQIQEKIDNLNEIYNGLQNLTKFSVADLKEKIENVWAVAFGIVAGIEAVLDISQYILASKGVKIDSYGSIPDKLFEEKIINKDFHRKMQEMIGFRNRAIHNYPSLDENQLHKVLQKDIKDFKEFLNIVSSYF